MTKADQKKKRVYAKYSHQIHYIIILSQLQ